MIENTHGEKVSLELTVKNKITHEDAHGENVSVEYAATKSNHELPNRGRTRQEHQPETGSNKIKLHTL